MSPLIQDGIQLTLIGMGVVFVLLTMLVFIIRGMSFISRRIEQSMPLPAPPATSASALPSQHEIVGVISAAIAAYRKHR